MNRKISIQFADVTGKPWRFEGLRELLTFCQGEAKYWSDKRQQISSNNVVKVIVVGTRFQEIVNAINGWGNSLISWNDQQFSQQMENLQNNYLTQINNAWLWSGHPFAELFVECNKSYGAEGATAFLDFILNRKITNFTHKNAFVGAMFAYEFLNQDSDLVKRRNAEKISLGQLRNQLEATTTTLISEVEEFKADFANWDSTVKKQWSEWVKSSSGKHAEQQEEQRGEVRNFISDCRTRIEELENTYQEKLRLEKPAKYWSLAANRYGRQGGLWSLALVAWVVVALVYFHGFFNSWLQGHEVGVNLQTLPGVVLSISLLTIFAFFAKTFARLAFSSFHLMRDAQEREQLTYLYLALINDKYVDESSRDIVLQALFSRSETGLLASETGPTMPGVAELLKASSKPH